MSIGEKRKYMKLLPLSHNPQLKKRDVDALGVYYDYLNAAFRNKRIKNIAITGARGIGKSSIIRSFEASRLPFFSHNPRFLYVSLGRYTQGSKEDGEYEITDASKADVGMQKTGESSAMAHVNNDAEHGINESIPDKDSINETERKRLEKNSLERRLLLQIYSRFTPKELPFSGYKLIPDSLRGRLFISLLFSAWILSILLLTFKEPLGQLITGYQFHVIGLQSVREYIITYCKPIQLLLYAFCFGLAILFTTILIYRSIPYLKKFKFSFKSNYTQFDLEKESCSDYLDQYTMELIYCLGRIGRKINRTVVFEDMDRLDTDVCIEIFTRLREINHMINMRLPKRKYIRFIFVTSDNITSCLVSTKFFDYILPIMPSLNFKSAELVFMQYLENINHSIQIATKKEKWFTYGILNVSRLIAWSLGKIPIVKAKYSDQLHTWSKGPEDNIETLFRKVESKDNKGIVHMVAEYIQDYRKQFAILNDYSVLVSLYVKNNPQKVTADDVEKILAFTVYKYLWPKNYQQAISGELSVLTGQNIDDVASEKNKDLLLWLKSTGKLSIRSLLYVGVSEEKVVKRFELVLQQCGINDVIEAIRHITAEDRRCLSILFDYCKQYSESSDERLVKILAATVECAFRCNYLEKNPQEWFFAGRTVRTCLDALLLLEDNICRWFLLSFDWKNPDNVYAVCSDWNDIPRYTKYWTEKKLRILYYGLRNFSRKFNIIVWNDELSMKIRETSMQEELKKFD